jgi:hypothetical protein
VWMSLAWRPVANSGGVQPGWRSVARSVWRSPVSRRLTPNMEETDANSHGWWVRPAAAVSERVGDSGVRASSDVVRWAVAAACERQRRCSSGGGGRAGGCGSGGWVGNGGGESGSTKLKCVKEWADAGR